MASTSTAPAASAVSERRLLWKIDLLLMPLMTIAYGLQFYDKAILASASIFGILKDLDLAVVHPGRPPKTSLERYSTATSAFYWGYLVAALPMALLVQRFRPNVFLGCAIVLWGIIVILTPAIGSWRGLIAQRFFLGAIESAVSPGFVQVTRSWYKRSEQPLRLGIWYSATGLFSIFSGLVNYGLGKAGTRAGAKLHAWKYMFLFAGSLSSTDPGDRLRFRVLVTAACTLTGSPSSGLGSRVDKSVNGVLGSLVASLCANPDPATFPSVPEGCA